MKFENTQFVHWYVYSAAIASYTLYFYTSQNKIILWIVIQACLDWINST